MNKSDIEEINITPEEYAHILEGFQLEEIALVECAASINPQGIKATQAATVNVRAKSDHFVHDNGLVEIYRHYFLVAKPPKAKKSFIEVNARYRMAFSNQVPVTESFLQIYQSMSSEFVVWPFFREFVNNVTSRMNVPPLTLPFVKESSE